MTTVVAHRCPTCGAIPPRTWTPERIIDAFQAWAVKHGRQPVQRDWRRATPFSPSKTTVIAMFGSWNAGVEAAGYVALKRGGRSELTRADVLAALLRWKFQYGELPTGPDWAAMTDEWPSCGQVRRMFGSWNAGIVAAGYEPRNRFRSVEGYQRQAGMSGRRRDARGRLVAA